MVPVITNAVATCKRWFLQAFAANAGENEYDSGALSPAARELAYDDYIRQNVQGPTL